LRIGLKHHVLNQSARILQIKNERTLRKRTLEGRSESLRGPPARMIAARRLCAIHGFIMS